MLSGGTSSGGSPADRAARGPVPAAVARISEFLLQGRSNVVLTGAGVSTESGLPDFRSKNGLWGQVDPVRVASLGAFRRDPESFYAFYRARLAMLAGAAPNAAHRAIARLETVGAIHTVITQNVDGLHQEAGSREVVEVHGNLREARCDGCGILSPIAEMTATLSTGALPRCGRCGGLLRPNVVLFEEVLPAAAYDRAETACRRCDVLLVVGSSLEVYPVAELPLLAVRNGARLVIVNRDPTPHDGLANVVLRETAGKVLPQVASTVEASEASEGG